MGFGNVVDEFLDQHSLPDTGTTKQTNLSTTSVGSKQVDNLDTGFQNLSSGGLLNEGGRVGMDRRKLDTLDGTPFVNWLTDDVHDTAQSTFADRNPDWSTSIDDLLSTDETLGTIHGNGSDRVLTKVSSDLEDETTAMEVLDFKSIENGWQVLGLELNIHDGTDDRLNVTDSSGSLRGIRARCRPRINASECSPNVFRRVLTRLLLGSANRSGVGGGVGSGRKGYPREVSRGREERVCPLGRAESLFSGARDSGEAPGR